MGLDIMGKYNIGDIVIYHNIKYKVGTITVGGNINGIEYGVTEVLNAYTWQNILEIDLKSEKEIRKQKLKKLKMLND